MVGVLKLSLEGENKREGDLIIVNFGIEGELGISSEELGIYKDEQNSRLE